MDDATVARLADWLDANLPGPETPIRVQKLVGGASNLTYRLERGPDSYALRRPPALSNDPTANNLRREMRLMTALRSSMIPHARMVTSCADDDAIVGAPFMISEWIDGIVPRPPFEDVFASAPHTAQICSAMIDGLSAVGMADWRALGLEGFGKPSGFLARQVDRWLGQLMRYRTRDLRHLDPLCEWLRSHCPQTQHVGLIHGDYQFVNVMFAPEPPVRLLAVMDWESATIGDPLLDLGWMLAHWYTRPEEDPRLVGIDWNRFPTREEMAARYAEKTGLNVGDLNFYMALALFKLAVIMEGWYARYRTGESTNPAHARTVDAVPRWIERAANLVGIG